MNEQVEKRIKFALTPRDGKWYELPNNQYIRWNFKLKMWDEMVVRDGKAISWSHAPADTELFGVE